MIELETAKRWLEKLDEIGLSYRANESTMDQAKEEFESFKPKFLELQETAAANSNTSLEWAAICSEMPVALRGADQLFLSMEERRKWLADAGNAVGRLPDEDSKGYCLGSLANLYTDRGDHQKALTFFRQRLEIAKQLGQEKAIVRSALNIGNTLLRLNQLPEARQQLHESLRMASSLQLKQDEARILNSLAIVAMRMKKPGLTVSLAARRLRVLKKANDQTQLASGHGNLGGWLVELGRFDEAQEHLNQALVLHRRNGSLLGQSQVIAKMAQLEEDRGNKELGIEMMQSAANIAKGAGAEEQWRDCLSEIERMRR